MNRKAPNALCAGAPDLIRDACVKACANACETARETPGVCAKRHEQRHGTRTNTQQRDAKSLRRKNLEETGN